MLDGDADLWGYEIEVGGRISDNWTVDFNLAYVDTEYTRYQYNFGAARLGFSDMKGNSVPVCPSTQPLVPRLIAGQSPTT
ncbi:MAG: hypothetical protein CM15mP74_27080 [Halieaceae bacterium]|nr:MAG: hypothetical protein CM15mP74_27080 [Halieaceae bacterium]